MKLNISLVLILLILVSSCAKVFLEKEPIVSPIDLTEEECSKAGGNWNECSSPCLGTGADYCIEVCVTQCECGGVAGFGCPNGYKCKLTGKIADELGVCILE